MVDVDEDGNTLPDVDSIDVSLDNAALGNVDIVAIGEALIEFNQTEPGKPHYLQGFGGDTSNAMIAAARQGARTAYVTRVGADPFGEQLRELWRIEGVDASNVRTDVQASTGAYVVQHGEHGHAFNYLRRGSAASRMQPADIPAGVIATAKCLYASGISMGISDTACDTVFAAMAQAREADVPVWFDSNLRPALWPLARARAVLLEAMRQADVFLPSTSDMTALIGLDDPQAILAWIRAQGVKGVVVLKLGAEGVLLDTGRDAPQTFAPHRVKSVDATGAGDCFAGSLLARVIAGDDWPTAVAYANMAAALSTTGFGAVAPIPRPATVMAALAAA